jgi:hypothetical protein
LDIKDLSFKNFKALPYKQIFTNNKTKNLVFYLIFRIFAKRKLYLLAYDALMLKNNSFYRWLKATLLEVSTEGIKLFPK